MFFGVGFQIRPNPMKNCWGDRPRFVDLIFHLPMSNQTKAGFPLRDLFRGKPFFLLSYELSAGTNDNRISLRAKKKSPSGKPA